MSFNGDNIQNVRSRAYVDLSGSNFTPGAAIIIYTLNQSPSGTANQQWRITPVPGGTRLFTIQSVLTGLYASIDGVASVNKEIVSGVADMAWQIDAIGGPYSHSVTIKVPYTNLVWNVAADAPLTNITLATQDPQSTGQQWTPRTALPPV